MQTKHFLLSKINGFAILTIAIGGLTAAQSLDLSPEVMGGIITTIGILNFILRTFYTKVPLIK